jgi:putative hydrolase
MKLIADCHLHTTASGHAYSTITEYAKEASEKGLELIAMTDHGPRMPGATHPYHFHNLKIIPKTLFDVEILKGMEANIIDYDGRLDIDEIMPEQLDVLIASFHGNCLTASSIAENTRAVIKSMECPYVNIIGHPDDSRIPMDYKELVKAAEFHGVLLEVNNSSLRPTSFRQNAKESYVKLLEECEKHKIYIIINSDSHIHCDVGELNEAIEMVKSVGFPKELIANTSVEKLKQRLYLRRR